MIAIPIPEWWLDCSLFRLGGDAVTDVLVQYLGREFKNKYKEDILLHKKGRAKLGVEAEKIKHVLSTLGNDFEVM